MKVTKWVSLDQEVEIEIGADDIRCALAEALANPIAEHEQHPDSGDVQRALNSIAQFLNAFTDEQFLKLPPAVRKAVAAFMAKQGARFVELVACADAASSPATTESTDPARDLQVDPKKDTP